ncbi:hypothetical protein [Aestuariirhabdus litorea]|uniref:hypothetical protein n=1 Tax=Aestuariirhabdus litorea TaxID=2528527 RepID=UPI001A9F2069|nr:hypothetical protein [Aestuariirhabdus litorea]
MTRRKKTKSISEELRKISKTTRKAIESSKTKKQTRREKPRQKSVYDKHLESQGQTATGGTGSAGGSGPKPATKPSAKPRPDDRKPSAAAKKPAQPAPKPAATEPKARGKKPKLDPDSFDEMSGEDLFDLFDRGTFRP